MKNNTKKISVTVGLTCLNEQENIINILNDILHQSELLFEIKKIIVISDGSTDKTVEYAKTIKNQKVIIYDFKDRKGKPSRLNEIFKLSRSDVVVILDADVRLSHKMVLNDLVRPFISNSEVMLTSGDNYPYQVNSFFQKVLLRGFYLWRDTISLVPNSEGYHCIGSIRAFHRKLYKQLNLPNVAAEDIHPYLFCMIKKLKFVSVPSAKVFFLLPKNYKDYKKQMKRYLKSKRNQSSIISKKIIDETYTVKLYHKLFALYKSFIDYPITTVSYAILLLMPKVEVFFDRTLTTSKWEMVKSSKKFSDNKKIIISNYDSINNPHYGGGGAAIMEKVAIKFSINNDVTIITGAYPESGRVKEKNGIRYVFISTSRFGPKLGQLIYSFLLPFYVLKEKHDIWIENFTPPFSTGFLPLFTSKPVIGVTHFLNAEEKSKEYHLPFTIVQNIGLKLYKHIITLTEKQKSKIKNLVPDANITIIPNATDITPQKKVLQKTGNYILFLGRIEISQKGLDLLISAFERIYERTNTSLIIAGSGQQNDEKKLQELILNSPAGNKIKFIGKVVGKQKLSIIRKAKCSVVSSRFEGQALTVIESIVLGTPIVSFDIDGLKWLSNKISLKSPAFDSTMLSENLWIIITNNILRNKMSSECIKISKKFSVSELVNRYQKVIFSVSP